MNSLITPRPTRLLVSRIATGLLIVLSAATAVHAEENGKRGFFDFFKGESSKIVAQTPAPPKYQQECASCHMAYPPGLLPAASWQHLMANLDKHFGTDASLSPADVSQIGNWLSANAGTYKRVSGAPSEDRISQSDWFMRKHRAGEVPANVWTRASVRSAANCVACHSGAEQGNFNEHQVRIPG
jgi:hypothetical protein